MKASVHLDARTRRSASCATASRHPRKAAPVRSGQSRRALTKGDDLIGSEDYAGDFIGRSRPSLLGRLAITKLFYKVLKIYIGIISRTNMNNHHLQ